MQTQLQCNLDFISSKFGQIVTTQLLQLTSMTT